MRLRTALARRLSSAAATALILAVSAPSAVFAQSEITVFAPFRGIATPIARAGSAVTVITQDEIQQAGLISVADILRNSPGVSFTGAGGIGTQKDVRIRGTEAQHTMVLIDGIPVSETFSTRNVFDFRTLPANIVERIEVLRGPQSALYGSDAIGGVINIITKQAGSGLSGSVSLEAGQLNTHRQTFDVSYGGAHFGVLASLSNTYSSSFSARANSPFSNQIANTEVDGFRQQAGFFRATVTPMEDLSIDAQFQMSDTLSEYDSATTNPTGLQDRVRMDGSVRARLSSFEDRWQQTLTAFASRTDLADTFDPPLSFVTFVDPPTRTTDFVGDRYGFDYTSEIRLDEFGTLLLGGGAERQTASLDRRPTDTDDFSSSDTYWNLFALHQFSLGPNLHLSTAIRFDDFDEAGTFVTGRATAVFEIPETETRFHASAGTGAKAPSLFQRFGTRLINPEPLKPEESLGFDFGVTQVLFDGLLTVDVTGFHNDIENALDFFDVDTTNFDFEDGYFRNLTRIETRGFEITADARIWPGQIDLSAHYTYLQAINEEDNTRLRRRPEHEGQISLTYYGLQNLTVTGTALFAAGEHISEYRGGVARRLNPYVRFDVNANLQVTENLELFGRVENLFDADYTERLGFSTTPRAGYVGVRGTF